MIVNFEIEWTEKPEYNGDYYFVGNRLDVKSNYGSQLVRKGFYHIVININPTDSSELTYDIFEFGNELPLKLSDFSGKWCRLYKLTEQINTNETT